MKSEFHRVRQTKGVRCVRDGSPLSNPYGSPRQRTKLLLLFRGWGTGDCKWPINHSVGRLCCSIRTSSYIFKSKTPCGAAKHSERGVMGGGCVGCVGDASINILACGTRRVTCFGVFILYTLQNLSSPRMFATPRKALSSSSTKLPRSSVALKQLLRLGTW